MVGPTDLYPVAPLLGYKTIGLNFLLISQVGYDAGLGTIPPVGDVCSHVAANIANRQFVVPLFGAQTRTKTQQRWVVLDE